MKTTLGFDAPTNDEDDGAGMAGAISGKRHIECVVGDFTAVARGKIVDGKNFLSQRGCRLPSVFLGLTLTAGEPMAIFPDLLPKTYDDIRLVPDLATARPRFMHPGDLTVLCEPAGPLMSRRYGHEIDASCFSPRFALRRVLGRLRRAGLSARVAPELEFFLLGKTGDDRRIEAAVAFPGSNARERSAEAFSLERAGHFSEYFDDLFASCELMGIPVTGYAHESALSQYEVNLDPGEPLAQADAVFRFKRIAKEIAVRRGYIASFAAKPFLDQPGTGMHWHLSLQRLGDEKWPHVFSSPDGANSAQLMQFVGGLQRQAVAATAIHAPYDLSFDRITMSDASPTRADWGNERRDVAFRIPASAAENRRIENRLPGGDANPYLTLAVMLSAGLSGLESSIAANAGDCGGHQLPTDLAAAISAHESSHHLREVLGDPLVDCYAAVKRHEHAERNSLEDPRSSWDLRYLLELA